MAEHRKDGCSDLKANLDDSLALARSCARFMDEKKVLDLAIFDLGDSCSVATHFVLGTGVNARHLQGVTENLQRYLKENHLRRPRVEGYREGKWILLDFGDVVLHLFQAESRRFYDLELLWGDSPRCDFSPAAL